MTLRGSRVGGDASRTSTGEQQLPHPRKLGQAFCDLLGGRSEVLDLGRSKRLFSPAQRKALLLRDRTCRAEGCDIPGRWCEAERHPNGDVRSHRRT